MNQTNKKNKKKGLLVQPATWFVTAILVFGTLIPNYYLWSARVPAHENLSRTQGILVHEKVSNRKGWKVGLASGDDLMSFTCSDRIGQRHTCYADRMKLSDHEELEGRFATVWWFEEPIYFFTTQKRLVQLDIGDTNLISQQDTVNTVTRRAERAPWWAAGALLLFCTLMALCAWLLPSNRAESYGNCAEK